LTIPANCTATVSLPISDPAQVRESGKSANEATGVSYLHVDGKGTVCAVGSGEYHFTGPIAR
jgi:alpha-L-rhamnosidase